MEDAIREARLAFAEAVGCGNAASAAALYAEDGKLLVPSSDLIVGRGEIEIYWRAGLDLGLSSIQLDVLELDVAGSVALEIGRYVLALRTRDRTPVVDCGKYLVVHRQEADSTWRRAVDVFNPDAPCVVGRTRKEQR
jgi:ketosteroid isomerase-like protein